MYNKVAMIELKKNLNKEFPNLIEKVVLFGSRVENNSDNYSDHDVLVVLKKPFNWRLKKRIWDTAFDINLDYDILTDIKLMSRGELNSTLGKLPFVQDALTKGFVL